MRGIKWHVHRLGNVEARHVAVEGLFTLLHLTRLTFLSGFYEFTAIIFSYRLRQSVHEM
jgi:hypothetical protein